MDLKFVVVMGLFWGIVMGLVTRSELGLKFGLVVMGMAMVLSSAFCLAGVIPVVVPVTTAVAVVVMFVVNRLPRK